MKIIYISRSIFPSRTANSINVMKMCEAFSNLGHEVILLAPWTKKLEEKGVENIFSYYGVKENFVLKKLFSPNIKYLKKRIYSLRCLAEVKKQNADFVYGRDDLMAFYLTQKAGFTTLFEQHEPIKPKSFDDFFLRKFLIHNNNKCKLLTISNKLKEIYANQYKIEKDSIGVTQSATDIFNQDDLPSSMQQYKEQINIGYIGSLFKGRGIDIIIALANNFSQYNFHIIGGKEKDINYWKEKAKSNNLIFHGFVNPKQTYLYRNMCDILLAPYETNKEGNRNSEYMSPIKIFEYLAAKKPVITSKMPAIEESVNENHVMFVQNNEITQWTKSLQLLIDDITLRTHLAESGYVHCMKNFTYKARVKKIMGFIQDDIT